MQIHLQGLECACKTQGILRHGARRAALGTACRYRRGEDRIEIFSDRGGSHLRSLAAH
jgi:hypothetical protein